MKAKFLGLTLIAVSTLLSCKKDDSDKTGPTITVSSPQNETSFEPGAQVTIIGTVNDNEALSQVEIDVHSAADGHSHKRGASNEFDYEWQKKISGTAYALNHTFTIPDSADTGAYHIIVRALDQAGNATSRTPIEIDVER